MSRLQEVTEALYVCSYAFSVSLPFISPLQLQLLGWISWPVVWPPGKHHGSHQRPPLKGPSPDDGSYEKSTISSEFAMTPELMSCFNKVKKLKKIKNYPCQKHCCSHRLGNCTVSSEICKQWFDNWMRLLNCFHITYRREQPIWVFCPLVLFWVPTQQLIILLFFVSNQIQSPKNDL